MVPFLDASFQNKLVAPGKINPIVGKGSLITFSYSFHRPNHDSNPLVLVTDVNYKGSRCRGLNLHYLTFPVIKKLLQSCENPTFSYAHFKSDEYITSAFREYKREGIEGLKKLDCKFIASAMSFSRNNFDPNEIEAIRKSVREQIQRLVNPQATSSPEMPFNSTQLP